MKKKRKFRYPSQRRSRQSALKRWYLNKGQVRPQTDKQRIAAVLDMVLYTRMAFEGTRDMDRHWYRQAIELAKRVRLTALRTLVPS